MKFIIEVVQTIMNAMFKIALSGMIIGLIIGIVVWLILSWGYIPLLFSLSHDLHGI